MTKEKKLFLLDAYALIFRAYYAFISNPMSNARGLRTSTIFGFALVLEEILKKENPSHIAVVFDPPGPTFRHELYAAYKATREETPEDIRTSIPYIKQLIEKYNIPILEEPGFEADDVIGTMARQAEREGYRVYMMTPDKDFTQLVSDNIFVYRPSRGGNGAEILGPDQVKEKFLVERPEQVIDILALWGDSSDNIPGAPGVGEVTARKLISQYQSVEGLYENLDSLKGKIRERLETSRDQVFMSKRLATISLNVPLTVGPADLERREMDRSGLASLFEELEFRTLGNRVLGEERVPKPDVVPAAASQGNLFEATVIAAATPVSPALQNIQTVEHQYDLVRDLEGVKRLAGMLGALREFCFDTETTGLDVICAELVGLAFSWEEGKAVYISFPDNRNETSLWLDVLKGPFSDPSIRKVGQNLKYDLHILKNYGVEVRGDLFDTMVAHFILRPEQKHNLNALAEHFLGYSMVKIEELIGKKGTVQASFRSVAPELAKEYAGEDADITCKLAQIFKTEISEKGFGDLLEKIEMPLVPVLMEMEHHGVRLDVGALNDFASELRQEILSVEQEIYRLAGMEFNISSPRQLGELLFERLKIISDPKKTRTRQYATGEDVLVQLSNKHPVIGKVLEYRSLRKLLSTYVEALPKLINQKTGKVHTSFNQVQAATGRLSSINPNLQNIPIREDRGREIRRAFIPGKEGNLFLSADYSQIELRLMAHLSGDVGMIRAFVNNEDIHTTTAAKIFNVPESQVSREMRSSAKTANFGIIYGISSFGLSQRLRISRTEAKQLIDGYFATYPGVKAYMDESIRRAREAGYVETMYGRRRYLPDILSRNSVVRGNAERNAINSPIQGSAADIIKIAMIRIQEEFKRKGLESCMNLQVHDELNFDVVPGEIQTVKEIVKEGMENATRLEVPLTIEMGSGANWLEAH
jgi:DNA polymerase I